MEPVRSSSLQLDEHLRFQQLLFGARRTGMALLAIVVVAALAGLFGDGGPLARKQAGAGAATVDYPRYARYHAPALLEFEVATASVQGDSFELVLGGAYVSDFSVEQVTPQPREVSATDSGIHYTFAVAPGERQHVTLAGQPEAIGRLAGTATLAGEPPLRIDSFVHP